MKLNRNECVNGLSSCQANIGDGHGNIKPKTKQGV